jgi:hypothetical protein
MSYFNHAFQKTFVGTNGFTGLSEGKLGTPGNILGGGYFAFVDAKISVTPLVNFWNNLAQNPSEQSRNELFNFLEHNAIPITEDGCFIGSRCIVVEGVRVEKEAVLGANVVLTQSTKIIDVSGAEPIEMKGRVPARSVVIPGSYTKKFPAGEFGVGCALIIGQRKPSTDLKTSLNDALRDFNVSV